MDSVLATEGSCSSTTAAGLAATGSEWRWAPTVTPATVIPFTGAGELTGFFPRIDLIFPSSTSKRYLRGSGLGFRAEILGVG